MPVIDLRVCAIGACTALIAGCSGSGSMMGSGGGNNSTMVTFTFTGTTMPAAVAAKVGTGAFMAQMLSGGVLTLTIPSGTSNYAVAVLCPAQTAGQLSSQSEFVWEASIADGTSQAYSCPYGPNQTGTLMGSLDAAAIPGVQSFWINSQNAGSVTSVSTTSGATASFNLPATPGTDRVLVLAYGNQSRLPVAAKNFDNQMVPGALNGGNTVVFSAADETTPETITYNNVASGFSNPSTVVTLAMGGDAESVMYAGGATTQYPALPATATENGDVYFFNASAAASGINPSSLIYAGTTSSGGPVSLTFPAPWSYAGPTPTALPSFTFAYAGFSGNTNAIQQTGIEWGPVSAIDFISVEATANYQGGSTTLAVPDLSGVAGFLAPPASGTQVRWNADMLQQSYSFTSKIPLNATWSSVSNGGSFIVP